MLLMKVYCRQRRYYV